LTEPHFLITWGTRVWSLNDGENIVGREPDAHIYLPSSSVSRRHARITVNGHRAGIEDLESKNGTLLGDRKITAPHVLTDGDRFTVGDFTLCFRLRLRSRPDATK
jgi:pSer/pThr/pTyr-binding forkhead associated (FHA) protein